MKTRKWLGVVASASLCVSMLANPAASTAQSSAIPALVYVSDFELDAANVAPDQSRVEQARTLVQRLRPLHQPKSPQEHAEAIVKQMSKALSDDLKQAGFEVRHLASGEARPTSGWLVRGVFLSVDEGNRVKRAVVGFGAGQGSIEVAVAIDNLAVQGTPQPIYQTVESDTSAYKPGAVVKLNPYVAAAKFVLAGTDEHTMIDHAASEISAAVVEKAKAAH